MKRFFLIFLVFPFLGGTCDGPQPVLSTQLEQLRTATMVSCDSYLPNEAHPALQRRTCLVLANPLRPNLRVFDLSAGHFILSPIGYSPLSVRVDGMTTKLVSVENGDRALAFGYNANGKDMFVLNANNQEQTSSFARATTISGLALLDQPLDVFSSGFSEQGNPQLLIAYDDGRMHLQTLTNGPGFGYEELVPSFGLTTQVAYDVESGLVAHLVSGLEKSVEIRNVTGQNSVSFTPISNVSDVKIALGTLKTNGTFAPHLVMMHQDEPKVRIIRLNTENSSIDFDKTLSLPSFVQKAYFPKTSDDVQPIENGSKDWFVVASVDGKAFFVTGENVDSPPLPANIKSIDLGKIVSAGYGAGLVQVLGGNVRTLTGEEAPKDRQICSRQLLFVFATGAVVSLCEGDLTRAALIVGRGTR